MTNTEKIEIEKKHPEAYKWAREFHDLYEETAPMFGYETRKETKEFDPTSPNGRLMAYVCFNLIQQAIAEERERVVGEIEFVKTNIAWDRTRGIDADSGDDAKQIGWDGACDLILFSLKPLTDKE